MDIILYEPEIPPNTGTISRLCAGFKIPLHLIEPLGFSLDNKYLKRAGLDYWDYVDLYRWNNYSECKEANKNRRMVYTSTKYGVPLHTFQFYSDDMIVFGPETRGIPQEILESEVEKAEYRSKVENKYYPPAIVTIATRKEIRSLNLALTVGIVAYQAMVSSGSIFDANYT